MNENFENQLDQLNFVKFQINKSSSNISKMKIRKNLIEEAKKEIENSKADIDLKQLEVLYAEANANISNLQKTFEELVAYHNNMVVEKLSL